MKLENYSNYEIDIENGTIYSLKRKCFMGHINKNDGYVSVTLHNDNGEQKTIKLHRIIWETANGSIPNGYDIHHKDHNRTNNSISNLEMIHQSEHRGNHIKGENNPNYGNFKKVECVSLSGEVIKTYNSLKETKLDGFTPSAISHTCNGDSNTYKGYKWRFVG